MRAFTQELGGVKAEVFSLEEAEQNYLRCPDRLATVKIEAALEKAGKEGDTLGGIVEIVAQGFPAGLGEPVFDKLDADLAKALMGIGSVKGVEIGAGFAAARMTGSQCNDPLMPSGFATNHAGGVLAGISNGEDLIIRVACKPISSIAKNQDTVDIQGNPVKLAIHGRHDVSVIPRIIPVCEAMVCLVLADHLLRQRAVLPLAGRG